MKSNNDFEKYLSRRIMGKDGYWLFFCRTCGQYKPETDFYKKKDRPFGIDSRCKIHTSRKDKDDDGDMDYLKLNPLTEEDFIETQRFLEKIGYSYSSDKPIWKQFNEKHGITTREDDND